MIRHFAAVLGAVLLSTAPAFAAADDSRELVQLPPMMRDHMLGNMRDHLVSLAEIQQALGAGDFGRAAEIAEARIGVSSLDTHGAAHMAPYMPEPMRRIGTAMHRAASAFAAVAQESAVDGDARRAVGALSAVVQECVACHAAYRVH
jgi:hypothetical protein